MSDFNVYDEIQARTGGEIYIGVVGPVRTGKSTFIRHFMELMAIPNLEHEKMEEIKDQLPVSGSGKIITTVEPKFIPKDAVEVFLGGENKAKIKMIDCVGYLIKDAAGHTENGKERMVKTPWSEEEIPFHEAAQIGTEKVIRQHSTIGILITSDGSFGEIPRSNFISAEERTVDELKKQNKPFMILVNTQNPHKEETATLVNELENKYQASAMAINCEQLKKDDIEKILKMILYEFPISEIRFHIPKWIEILNKEDPIKEQLLLKIKNISQKMKKIKNINRSTVQIDTVYTESTILEKINLSNGIIDVRINMKDEYYYKMLSEMCEISIQSEYDLIYTIKKLIEMKKQFQKVETALYAVKNTGYGVVVPERSEIELETPSVIRQGNRFGVKISSKSPSIHMIRANIETEIAPIVGTQEQANDLIQYINESESRGVSIWETNIFGKSLEQMVMEGIHNKISLISDESQVKLQDTMRKIVNDSKGGLVCIII